MNRDEMLKWAVDNINPWPKSIDARIPYKPSTEWLWKAGETHYFLYRPGYLAITVDDWVGATQKGTRDWDGNGLPPAGEFCEAIWTSQEGVYGKVFVFGIDSAGSLAYEMGRNSKWNPDR